jgi:hypothetical protein
MNVHSKSNGGSFTEQMKCRAVAALGLAGFSEGFDFPRHGESEGPKTTSGVGVPAPMLLESLIEIDGRPDVMTSGRTLQDVNSGHSKICQGGELNSRPRAYESPALPLSYPGVKESNYLIVLDCSDQPRKLSGLLCH